MLAWLAPLVVFGIVVFVHELGHFLAAKLVGVYAPRFSIGFGRALIRRRRGETEYILAAIPLGGYVRLASKDDEATAFLEGGSENAATTPVVTKDFDPNAMIPFGPKPIPPDRWMESKSLPGRLLIMLAGVTMNVVLGFVVLTGMIAGYGRPYLSTRADSVAVGKPAALAGLKAGDSLIAVNGKPVTEWQELLDKIGSSAGVPIRLTVIRNEQESPGGLVTRERKEIDVTPLAEAVPNSERGKPDTVGRIGIVSRMGRTKVPVGEAVVDGARATVGMAGAVFGALRQIASRKIGVDQLGGPIAIAQSSVQAARSGLETFLFLIALISVNLAVFNLLPIPILDGGQILIMLLEAAKGSAFSAKTREYILKAGLGAILLLISVVMYNDLRRLVQELIKNFG